VHAARIDAGLRGLTAVVVVVWVVGVWNLEGLQVEEF